MRCFAKRSKNTDERRQERSIMCPERSFAERECNGMRSDSEAIHFFILIILLQRDFFIIVRKFSFFRFYFSKRGWGELEK